MNEHEIIEMLSDKLVGAFPEDFIQIQVNFRSYAHRRKQHIEYAVYIESRGVSNDFGSIQETTEYVDKMIFYKTGNGKEIEGLKKELAKWKA